ncbi:M50 family metallopeptidase [Eupransor demetentiae]|uniref:Regulator of RpoE activity (RseP) n=1 Tax=Eupransor demetentiae TaxID=3109584 RepID=A0ABP0ENQ1_9LACO|nr:Membrane-associated protease RseP [Lactobacillaceae bacterium LMG 33000]
MFTTIFIYIFMFGLLVEFHELGHYRSAKRNGVLVREFSIGYGPKLLSWYKHGTAYAVRLLPIGGFVRLASANDESPIQAGQILRLVLNDKGEVTVLDTRVDQLGEGLAFQVDQYDLTDDLKISGYRLADNQYLTLHVLHSAYVIQKDGQRFQIAPRDTWRQSVGFWRRFRINIAGPMMNLLFALLAFTVLSLTNPNGISSNRPIISSVDNGQPAQKAGLKVGDTIKSIDGDKVSSTNEVTAALNKHSYGSTTIVVERNKKNYSFTLLPTTEKVGNINKRQIGANVGFKTNFSDRLTGGIRITVHNTVASIVVVYELLTHWTFGLNQVGGTISIANATSDVATNLSVFKLAQIFGNISITIAILSLVPLPPLDGGKILLDLWSKIFRRSLPQVTENIINILGAGVILTVLIAVTTNDLLR